MNLSSPFIQRPIMTSLVMFAILLIGIASYLKLPVSNMPDIAYPVINVLVNFPGASPEVMANNVAVPLEKQFLAIEGLASVTSTNALGSTSIILQFDINKNIDAAAQDVQAAISAALPNLPPQLPSAPIYKKVNPSLTPIFVMALVSDTMPLHDLYDYANTFIGQRLAIINGVAQVFVYGSPYAVRVQVDPKKIASLGVTLQDISTVLSDGNPYLPTGLLNGPIRSSTIIANGELLKASDFNPLIVSYVNNAPIRIKDLGEAVDSLQNYRLSISYIDQNQQLPGVALAILPQPGSNAVQISKDIKKILPGLMEQIPPSIKLKIVNDKSDPIQESIFDVQITLLIAFILVVFIIFIYLGKARDTIIPILVLPMSVFGTFGMMHLLGYSLDNLSLLAIILAIGFIIDDAIVVIENIVRHIEKGESPWNAAIEGSRQISFTIVSMTLSLVAVFIPLLFMAGLIGKILAEFAITLTVITLISGFISLTLTPMLCSLFLPARESLNDEIKGWAGFGQRMNQRMVYVYRPCLQWILQHRGVAILVMLVSLVLSVWLLAALPKDFIPNDDIGFFIIYTQAAEGVSSTRMIELQAKLEKIVQNHPSVDNFLSIVAFTEFRNGLLYIRLKPLSERKSVMEVIKDLQKQTSEVIGINSYYKNIPMVDLSMGAQVKGTYQYALQSLDPKLIYPAAEKFIERMQTIKGIQGVNSDMEVLSPELFVDILRDQASTYGVTASNVETILQLAYAGGRVSRIQTPIDQYDIILEFAPKFQKDASILDMVYARSLITNKLVPMSTVAHWYEGIGPASINHIDQFPAVTISYNLDSDVSLSAILKELKKIGKQTLPKAVSGEVVGAAQAFEESLLSAAILLIVTVLAIYIVLGVLYESYIHPITILTTLPPATLGGLLTLYVFGYTLSLYSFLGIILLIGIVKKNGIMIVDFALENIRLKGESAEKSIYDACLVRFRPIMMTTLTSIMGALPIAFGVGAGAEARRPLGLVIIGGLMLSQLITLFITPVVYLYLEEFKEWLMNEKPPKVRNE